MSSALRNLPALAVALVLCASCSEDDARFPGEHTAPSIPDDFCHGVADGTLCDDGNPCTSGDRCGGGVCLGRADDEGATCDDGNACTTGDTCGGGVCTGGLKDCSGETTICAVATCSPDTGECQLSPHPDGQLCSDGDLCTHDDACLGGACSGAPVVCGEATTPCGTRVCDPASGSCASGPPKPDGEACDDGDLCTLADACSTGTCAGLAKDCASLDAECIAGVCNGASGLCEAQAVPTGAPCDDGNPCSVGETCAASQCGGATEAPNGTPCTDSDPCTVAEQCVAGTCKVEARDCSAAGSLDGCAVGECDALTGECLQKPVIAPGCACFLEPDGTACNDGNPCTEGDACAGSACVGGTTKVCTASGNACVDDVCNTATGLCGVPVTDGTPCQDGDECTVDDACWAGQCKGPNLCVCAGKADGTPCNDKDPCTDQAACDGEVCVGALKDCSAESTSDGCALGVCEPITGLCVAELVVAPGCQCFLKANGTSCDDENPCTTGDACQNNLCGGSPKDCSSSASACVLGVCDPATGGCGVPLEDGTACSDAEVCTANDTCSAGQCVGTDVCFCKGKADGTPCDDGLSCTDSDACNGGSCGGLPRSCAELDSECATGGCDPANGTCIAVPKDAGTGCDDGDACTASDTCVGLACEGAPVDCSSLDSDCTQGGCTLGACVAEPRPDATPCNDGDACSGADVCASGACGGTIDLCGTCAGQLAGTPCDDADPCTVNTVCTPLGEVTACASGAQKDCSAVSTACRVGACDAETGACVPVPITDDTSCDDGDACTDSDRCTAGACAGSSLALCGSSPDICEEPSPNGQRTEAHPLKLDASGAVELLGALDPAGETDWYAVELEAGEELTVEIHSHCGSALDTLLGVYDPSGTPLAQADDGGVGGWSKVAKLPVETSGVHTLGLTAYTKAGTGRYRLAVASAVPPPCSGDGDCGCADLGCVIGKCVPKAPLVSTIAGSAATAAPLAVGDDVTGTLEDVFSADWFRITLTPDVPVHFETRPHCDDALDTELLIYDATGYGVLGGAVDGGAGGHARVTGFVAPEAGEYLVRIADEAGGKGRYGLSVTDGRCTADTDCSCGDSACDGSPGAPGQCVPLLTAPEAEAAAPVAVGQRLHSEISEPYDVDAFALYLGAGAWNFETLPYCGLELDTELALYDGDGQLLGSNFDAAGTFMAGLVGFTLDKAGPLRLEVWAYGAGTGSYLVRVTPK